MSKLTLDEAIKHCLERAEENDNCADKCEAVYGEDNGIIEACRECAEEHRQLAEWLTELKEAKRLLKAAVEDINVVEGCETCVCYPAFYSARCQTDDCYKWRYTGEALKLIGGENDERPSENKG